MNERLVVTTLGDLSFKLGGEIVPGFTSRKAEALLVYLAVEKTTAHRRESLFTLLWPGMPESSARNNLRQVLFSLRKAIPEVTAIDLDEEPVPLLLTDRQTVQVNPAAPVEVDIWQIDQLLEMVQVHDHLNLAGCEACVGSLEKVISLYRGSFLSNFYLEDSSEFEDWAEANREAYRGKALSTFETLAEIYIQKGDYEGASSFAEGQLKIDPLREGAYRQLMEMYSKSGQRTEAIRAYQRCARILDIELGTSPSRETTALYEIISGEDLQGASATPREGSIRGYQIREHLGSGHTGMVYRAFQPVINRDVAVKVIAPQFANHPDFIRRFEVEAQLVARLEHPYIVPLYDYWRDPSGAYLVMRWLKGGSLQDDLARGPWMPEPAVQFINQISAALSFAHRQGVVHCDIKPGNILLDEENSAYLTDFGIAILTGPLAQLSQYIDIGDDGSSSGSLGYTSPEVARGQQTTPLADVYSLGVVLFELLTAHHPFPGLEGQALIQKHLTEPLPSVRKLRAELPPAVDEVIQQATNKDPGQRYQDVGQLAKAFRQAISPEIAVRTEVPDTFFEVRNPYKGLRSFEEADSLDYFGRDQLVQRLSGKLSPVDEVTLGDKFLAVVGPSGSGKSSVVNAGLIPAIRKGNIPGSERWFVVEMTPGSHPLEELETALLRIAIETPEDLLKQMQADPRGLLRVLRKALPGVDDEVLLVIDQFEELFTLVEDEADRKQFMEMLAAAVRDPHSPLRVVITLRADFYDRPLQHGTFGELVREGTEVVLPLNPEELERSICGPAEVVGMSLEAALVARIVQEVGDQPGALPLLQYALTETFEHSQDGQLNLTAYEASGGVLGALGRRAEEIYSGLEKTEQEMVRQLFLRLVTLGEGVEDTRRRVMLAEIEAAGSQLSEGFNPVIDRYGRYRLLTFDHDPATRAPTVEVAHEALLREWSRLRGWLDESRDDVRTQRLLAGAMGEWQENRKDLGFLLRGTRLDQFALWAEDSNIALTEDENIYLAASLEKRKEREVAEAERQFHETELERRSRRFLWGIVGVFAISAVLAVVLSIYSFGQRQAAQTQAGILLASQAESELEDGFSDRAVLLALEALENYPYTAQAEHALGQAVTYNRALELYEGHVSAVTGAAWSSDGARIATTDTDNSVHIWDPNTGEMITQINLPEGITGNINDWGLTVKWSPDDRYLLTISGDRWLLGSQEYDLILWDVTTGDQVAAYEVQNATPPDAGDSDSYFYHYTTGAGAAFAPDGRLASMGGDNTALVLAPMLGDEQLVLRGHAAAVNGVDWSPDFTMLATASEDGSARIWDADSGDELMQLSGHDGPVNQVVWSPDGSLLATAGDDDVVQFWDAASGENLTEMIIVPTKEDLAVDERVVYSLAWSQDGEYLATGTGDGIIRLWRVDSGEMIAEMKGHNVLITYLEWSPLDERLVSAGADGRARIWNSAPDNIVLSLPYEYIASGGWSPDGAYIAAGSNPGPDRAYQGMVAVWDFEAREPLFETFVDKDGDWYWDILVYSPDGEYLLARTLFQWPDLTDANKFYLLDSQSGEVVRTLETYTDTILLIPGWSPDGRIVGSGILGGTIYFWEVSSGELIRTMDCVPFPKIVRWSPDGDKIAMLCLDYPNNLHKIRVLDAETYETLLTIERSEPMSDFNWSPDSTRFVVGGGNDEGGTASNPIYIFDANSGEELLKIDRHTGMIWGVDWSPDGKRVVSGSTDDTTRIWDVGTGAELLTLSTPGDWVVDPAWSPDGQYLLVNISNTEGGPGRSGVRRVWQTTEELIEYAYDCCVFRDLTPKEREQFGLPEKE